MPRCAVSGMDLYGKDFHRQKTKKAAYTEYLQELLSCIKEFTSFNVLGHVDLVRRYGSYKDNSMKHADFGDLLDLIFEELISTGKGLELNTSGFRYKLQSTMPDLNILKRYREMGGEILTIGSDAHSPHHVAEYFDFASDLARKAGLRYITRFTGNRSLSNYKKWPWPLYWRVYIPCFHVFKNRFPCFCSSFWMVQHIRTCGSLNSNMAVSYAPDTYFSVISISVHRSLSEPLLALKLPWVCR